jgi:hypothetical protein
MRTNLTISIDSELKKKIKAYCSLKSFTMSELVTNFFWSILEEREFEEEFTKGGFKNILKQEREIINALKKETLLEIKQTFTSKEASLMIDALNGFIYTPEASSRDVLIAEIMDAIKYQKLDEKWKVDKDKLLSKLASLSSFQAFVILQTIAEFWEEDRTELLDEYIGKLSS